MKNFIFIAILAVAFCGCDDKKAEQTQILNQQCADNDANSCKELGDLYFNGDNSPEGFTMAFEYHKKACILNRHLLCREIANLYFKNGLKQACFDFGYADLCKKLADIQKDDATSFRFRKEACVIDKSFCREFGDLYFENKDYAKAFTLHGKICDQKNSNLCRELGDLYFKNKDYARAYFLYQDACEYDFSLCKEFGDLYFKNKDYAKAFTLYIKLCEKDSKVCKEFGDFYFKNKDYEKAVNFHKKLCETDSKVCEKFANIYPNKYKSEFEEVLCKNPYECEKIADTYIKRNNYKKAKEILRQISDSFDIAYNGKNYVKSRLIYEILCDERNNAAACNNLGVLYNSGRGVARNAAKAFYYFKESCDMGDGEIACNNLGYRYYYGDGTQRDYFKAKEAWQKSCDNGSADGCAWLGELYALGRGVRQDLATAKEYFGKGCDMGSQKGCDGDKSIKRRNPQGNVIMRQEMILR